MWKTPGTHLGKVPAVDGPVQEISRKEVKKAIKSMKKGKCSSFPILLVRHLGDSGVDMMHESYREFGKKTRCQKSGRKVYSKSTSGKRK